MHNELTESQINFYQENGFLVIENFLDADELAEWCRCTDESVEERLGNSVEFMTNQMDAKQFYARVFTQCLRLSDTHWYMIRDSVRWQRSWLALMVYEFGTTKL